MEGTGFEMSLFMKTMRDRFLSYLPDRYRERATHAALFMLTTMGLRPVLLKLMKGPTLPDGRPGTLLTAGSEPWIGYLPHRFFRSEPDCRLIATVSFRELSGYIERFRKDVDLSIVRVNRWSARRPFGHACFSVPEWVGMKLAVPDDLEQLTRSGKSIRSDMALMRRYRYQPAIAHNAAEFDRFYHSVYAPFSLARYGEMTVIRDSHDLRRRFSSGGILWIEREGKHTAAALFERKDRTLHLLALGTLNGDYALVREGALAAIYYHIIKLAQDLGCTTVDFKGSRPSLYDGLLRYKKKWGASLYDMTSCYYDVLIGWEKPNQVVREFFTHTPLIFRERGQLSALAGNEFGKRFPSWIHGLHRMHLITESGCHPVNADKEEECNAKTVNYRK